MSVRASPPWWPLANGFACFAPELAPFPLIIARHSQAAEVIGIEKNPVAHAYALDNRRANRTLRGVRFLAGDAAEVLPTLEPGFDRMLVVLPYGGEGLLPVALAGLRSGGVLHFYDMQAKGCHRATIAKVETMAQSLGLQAQSLDVITCGNCGPTTHRVCLDAIITTTV